MKRGTLLYWVDLLIAFILILIGSTAAIMEWVVPVDPAGILQPVWLGWTHHDWGELHSKFGIAFLIGIALHVGLHWKWIVHATRSRFAGSRASDE